LEGGHGGGERGSDAQRRNLGGGEGRLSSGPEHAGIEEDGTPLSFWKRSLASRNAAHELLLDCYYSPLHLQGKFTLQCFASSEPCRGVWYYGKINSEGTQFIVWLEEDTPYINYRDYT
jgi:hypothetical protein